MKRTVAASLLCLFAVLAGCRREQASVPPAPTAEGQAPQAGAAPPAGPLQDVSERDPRYLVGISYPKGLARYPGLEAALRQYADAARAELQQAVDGLGDARPSAPYDLSLVFDTVVDTPDVVAVAADGSSYTGGAHGAPLVARFVWLPRQQAMLTARALVPDAGGWRDVSDYAREQLHAALSQRLDADDLSPADRAGMMKSALKMIDDGTAPGPEDFEQFEPVVGADGRLSALRFVFPPYQVGPYSDGVQSVEVPAAVLLPHVAPAYRALFAGG